MQFDYEEIKALGFHRVTVKDPEFFRAYGRDRCELLYKTPVKDAFLSYIVWDSENRWVFKILQRTSTSKMIQKQLFTISSIKKWMRQ